MATFKVTVSCHIPDNVVLITYLTAANIVAALNAAKNAAADIFPMNPDLPYGSGVKYEIEELQS